MSRSTAWLGPAGAEYLHRLAIVDESPLHAELRERTAALEDPDMQISPEQGRLMGLLTQLVGARRAIEVGVFTGYSALWVAERLPADGLLVACDVSEEFTAIAREFWQRAGVADRIDLRLGPAARTLAAMRAGGEDGTFDLAFVDADKPNDALYYEQCLGLLRPGGLVLIDNVLRDGAVFDPTDTGERVAATRELSARVMVDQRVDAALVPISDGVLIARKRG